MRHSIPENVDLPTEQIPLSKEGIELAKKKKIKANKVFASFYLRAKQTASYLANEVEIIEGIHERVIGNPTCDFWPMQYENHDFKNEYGESLNEVKSRMKKGIDYILTKTNDQETSLVVSHATAICAYLLNYCTVDVIDPKQKTRRITFNNKVLLEGVINKLDSFVLLFDNDEIVSITFEKNI